MNLDKTRYLTFLATLLLFLPGVINAQAQIYISKNADFSTSDRAFESTDTLHIMVRADNLFAGDLDKNDLVLRSEFGPDALETTFVNNMDGTYTKAMALASLNPSQQTWVLKLRLKDENDREIRASVGIAVGTDAAPNTIDLFEMTGFIDQTGPDALVLQKQPILYGDALQVRDENNQSIATADLAVLQFITARGAIDATGNFIADWIRQRSFYANKIEMTGTLESYSNNTLTIAGQTFIIDKNTTVLDTGGRQPIPLSSLIIGQVVEVQADVVNDQQIATQIARDELFDDVVKVRGVISALTGPTLTILGQTFVVTPNTFFAVFLKNNAGLAPQDSLEFPVNILADRQPDGTLLTISGIEGLENNQMHVEGRVDSINVDVLQVDGMYLRLDDATQYVDEHNNAILSQNIAHGQLVTVLAVKEGDDMPRVTEVGRMSVAAIEGHLNLFEPNGSVQIGNVTFDLAPDWMLISNTNTLTFDIIPFVNKYVRARIKTVRGVQTVDEIRLFESDHPYITSTTLPDEQPTTTQLLPNYPNPFNPTTTISFAINGHTPGTVTLTVYNVLGQEIKQLLHGHYTPGTYSVSWDATDQAGQGVASGMYFYRLQVTNQPTQTRSMTLLR